MSNLDICPIEEAASRRIPYKVFVGALGYESRSSALVELAENSAARIAFGFDHNLVLAHDTNRARFQDKGFVVYEDLGPEAFANLFRSKVLSVIECEAQVAIDISCFDRRRLAEIFEGIRRLPVSSFSVDFYYSVAAFVPPHPVFGRNEVAGPVHKQFAGRFLDPGRPLALIAGLGYEIGKVVGAAEYVQASRVIALIPRSPVFEYEPEVVKANKVLLDDIAAHDVIYYEVDDPRRTVATLDAVVRGLSQSHNVVILPGGPKVFALCSLITQTLNPNTSVWRVSSGSSISARDVAASGNVVGVRVRFCSETLRSPF